MGILSTIFSKIFPSAHAVNGPAPAASEASVTVAGAAPSPTPMAEVDVEKMLNDMAANSAEKLNWKTSIVDLMKLLGIDSSLASRQALAQELKYTSDVNDSAADHLTIDCMDSDGIYEPGNRRWATHQQQTLPRRPRPVSAPPP